MLKTSFLPIESSDIEILILGSIPGDKSLEMQQYYAHPQNRFWTMMALLTHTEKPADYAQKIELLLRNKIGLWDVAHTAERQGSLDSAIRHEQPNDIEGFLQTHPSIKVVAFNGQKARAMFNKFFREHDNLQYYTLPSTSPANAAIRIDGLCRQWQQIFR